MEINIASPSFSKNETAKKLVDSLERDQEELYFSNAVLYYEFPLFREANEYLQYPTFTIISPYHGIIIIQCDNRTQRTLSQKEMSNLLAQIDQIYNYVYSKFIKFPTFRAKGKRNQLNIEVSTILYLPYYRAEIPDIDDYEDIAAATQYPDLKSLINSQKIDPLPDDVLGEIFSVLDGTRTLRKPQHRNITDYTKDKKGGLLEELEKEIAKFDQQQKLAALTQIDGPQRIRGLAGSGKTVVLAMKAALIHLKSPDAKILYTFYTKALYDHVRNLVTRFYRMHEDQDPDWDKLHIRHAWGGKSVSGVYYDTCKVNSITPLTLSEAKGGKRDPFDYVCLDLMEKTNGKPKRTYDYVLMDEGQDFPDSFYWLCRAIVKKDCIVWAYDELQTIIDVDRQHSNVEVFKNAYGYETIDLAKLQDNFPRQNNDIVLHKCYRNPREILVVAHAIGFGIYNKPILQRLENKAHWNDLGYEVLKGNCVKGEHTIINRPIINSPSSISSRQTIGDIIQSYVAKDFTDEVNWVCTSIKQDISEKVLPEDILVISLDNRNARTYFKHIGEQLRKSKILSNNILESYTGDDFMKEGCVTLSTIYRAKGNEGAIVYVVGVDVLSAYNRNDIVERNKLFTAFTRAKGWLRISGIGSGFSFLIKEVEDAISNFPKLDFIYPGEEEIRTLRRELADANETQMNRLRQLQEKIEELGLGTDEAIDLLQTRRKK